MAIGSLGTVYRDGETIIRQGDEGNCMYVIQEGQAEVCVRKGEGELRLALLTQGDFFGEMALFDREIRSATVRSVGESRVLTISKKSLLRRIQEDPTLALRLIETLTGRIRQLNKEVIRSAADGGEPNH
jgi:CRP/FNR family cyclic AMP-dependent transcriptional regulator